jgi:glutathione peroxidase
MKLCLSVMFSLLCFFAHARDGMPKSIYKFKLVALNGKTIDLAGYKGKKILFVNTPVKITNMSQYPELEVLYQKYKDKLVIIGIMTDGFAKEPMSKKKKPQPEQKNEYPVTFPLSAVLSVTGEEMTPLYKWLGQKKYNKVADSEVQWDFDRYLVDEKGKLVKFFSHNVKTTDPDFVSAINK